MDNITTRSFVHLAPIGAFSCPSLSFFFSQYRGTISTSIQKENTKHGIPLGKTCKKTIFIIIIITIFFDVAFLFLYHTHRHAYIHTFFYSHLFTYLHKCNSL